MPNPGRSPDEASPNGAKTEQEAGEIARFPRPAEPLRGFAFGGFVLDLARGALLQHEIEIRLRAKSLDVLTYLVRHPGRLISKRELIEAIWPDVAVTDDSLVQCLVEIRRALGDAQAWVHTARGRKYRFDGDVRRALALDPNAPRAHMLYALFLGSMGRFDESLRESQTALALKPGSPTVSASRVAGAGVRGACARDGDPPDLPAVRSAA